MLELAGVGKTVGDETHLAAIDLRLRAGVFSVLLGPTLAGKTSLLRVMAGLDRPSGASFVRRARCHRRRCSPPQCGDGVSAIHQLSDDDRFR